MNFNFVVFLLKLIILIVVFPKISFAQDDEPEEYDPNSRKESKYKSYFGIGYKPIFPTRVFRSGPIKTLNDTVAFGISPTFGFSLGMTVRIGLSKKFSIESGLYMLQRNYNLSYKYKESILVSNKLGMLNYELPINALVYIQLSKSIYSSVSTGPSLSFYNADFLTFVIKNEHKFSQEARRTARVAIDLNANLGFEYRTSKKGTYYVGFSAKIPVKPIYNTVAVLEKPGNQKSILYKGSILGSYLSLDFKYFLHTKKKKGEQFQGGPITQ
jgi:hypothetical protein